MGNNFENFDEEKLIEIVKPYFDLARFGDWEHALRVVKWVKELGQNRSDLNALIVAAYIHDIGWSGVAPRGKIDLEKMLELEPVANKNSSKLISEVLLKLKFTKKEIDTIKRLVAAADKHAAEFDDEEIIVDADNLSKLCLEHFEQKYQKQSFSKLVNLLEEELSVRIKTEKGKKLFPELLADLKIIMAESKSLLLAKNYLGKEVKLIIDRPLGSKHPKHDFIYECNYGFIPGVMAPDGEELDAYFLNNEPLKEALGICRAVIHRFEDDDDKLVVFPPDVNLSDEEIEQKINFQEKFFKHSIIRE